MKTATSILLAISPLFCTAQVKILKARVSDHETGKPVAGAYVFFQGADSGTATNTDGEFELAAKDLNNRTLTISALPYKTYAANTSGNISEIKLEPLTPAQNTKKNPQETIRIVIEAIEKIPVNFDSASINETFYREYIKSFNNIIQYVEVAFSTNSHRMNEVIDASYIEDKHQRGLFWNQNSGGFYTFDLFDISKSQNPSKHCFLGAYLKQSSDIGKYYSFISKGTLKSQDNSIHVIEFDQKNIKGSFLKGTLYIDSLSEAIVKINYSLSPKGLKYILPNRTIGGLRICKPPLRIEILRHEGEISYHRLKNNKENKWNFTNSFTDIQFNASFDSVQTQNAEKHYLKMHNETVVTSTEAITSNPTGPPLTRRYIKDKYERDDHAKSTRIKPDSAIRQVSETLLPNNAFWERNEARKAKENLISSTTFTPQQLQSDLDYLKEVLCLLHPAPYDHITKNQYDLLFQNARKRLNRNLTDNEFYKLLVPVIERLGCSHTQLRPSECTEQYNKKFGKYFPYDIIVNGRNIFLRSQQQDSSTIEVVKINGIPGAAILHALQDKVSADGLAISSKQSLITATFPILFATHIDQPDTFKLELKDWKAKRSFCEKIAARHFPITDEDQRATYLDIDSLQTSVITIPSFISCQNLSEFIKASFFAISKKGHTNLILDLRDNATTNDSLGPMVYSYLSSQPFRFYDRIEIASEDKSHWKKVSLGKINFTEAFPDFTSGINVTDSLISFTNHPNLHYQNASDRTFNGNVYILVNEGTNSTAAEIAVLSSLHKRAILIGKEITADIHGTLGRGTPIITIPNSKIRLIMPLAKYKLAVERGPVNSRLVPDVATADALPSNINGKDREMEAALKLIVENCCTAKSN